MTEFSIIKVVVGVVKLCFVNAVFLSCFVIYKKERVIYTYDMLFDRFIANKYLPIFCSYRS